VHVEDARLENTVNASTLQMRLKLQSVNCEEENIMYNDAEPVVVVQTEPPKVPRLYPCNEAIRGAGKQNSPLLSGHRYIEIEDPALFKLNDVNETLSFVEALVVINQLHS
jgi:hypothetical protein